MVIKPYQTYINVSSRDTKFRKLIQLESIFTYLYFDIIMSEAINGATITPTLKLPRSRSVQVNKHRCASRLADILADQFLFPLEYAG